VKRIPLNHGLTLEQVLDAASHEEVVLTDEADHVRFAVRPRNGEGPSDP